MDSKKINRTRNNKITVYLSDAELERLNSKVDRTLLNREQFIRNIDTIARIMQEEGHLNCTSYWASKGINRGGKKEQPNPYKWKSTSVYNILKRQEYCGDVLNFKTHSKSFKNHRRIDNPKEDWLIFEDVHDPIIDRNTYNKVQKMLANTKHRAPKEENGPKSIFCDLLYCADCHKKMWYHTNTVN